MYWKMWIFQSTQYLVTETSNLLVGTMYWMIAFKVHVFDAWLFEETPNRSNSEIWESFLSWMFSPVFWRLSKSVLPSCK